MRTAIVCISSILTVSLLISCSKAEREWESLQKFQGDKMTVVQSNAEYDLKIEACQAVVDSLSAFMGKHKDGKHIQNAQDAVRLWEQRKVTFERQKDFQVLGTTRGMSEQILKTTYDYDVRTQACDNVISSLQKFLYKYPVAEETPLVKTSLDAWKSRKAEIENEYASLLSKFAELSRQSCIKAATDRHPLSNIESIELEKREKQVMGFNIAIRDIYAVRMKGRILGTSIFKLRITVDGSIAADTKQTSVGKSPLIEE